MDKSEERFLAKLAELIKEFQPDKMPSNTSQPLTLDTLLNHENISPKKSHRINTNLDFKFNEFVEQLEKTEFYQGLIPYDKITECVFDNTPPEMLYTFTGSYAIEVTNTFKVRRYLLAMRKMSVWKKLLQTCCKLLKTEF